MTCARTSRPRSIFRKRRSIFSRTGRLEERIQSVRDHFGGVEQSARQGRLLRDGMTVVIAGRPNAGKSSLLNRLAGYDAAIVTPVPGTTRDVLRERIAIDGMPLHVLDTAGLRPSSGRDRSGGHPSCARGDEAGRSRAVRGRCRNRSRGSLVSGGARAPAARCACDAGVQQMRSGDRHSGRRHGHRAAARDDFGSQRRRAWKCFARISNPAWATAPPRPARCQRGSGTLKRSDARGDGVETGSTASEGAPRRRARGGGAARGAARAERSHG